VLHSRNDDVIPFRLGKSLYDGLTVPKEMITSEVQGHCAMQEYDAVSRFVKSVSAHTP
jgi:hypothetical protein